MVMPPRAQRLDQRRRDEDAAEHHDGSQHVEGHARPLRAVDLGDEVLAVLAQARAFGGDVEGVEELLHLAASLGVERGGERPVAKAERGLVMTFGRQRSSSEQARQRSARQTGGGVRPAANRAAKASRGVLGQLPQIGVERHHDAPSRLAVEQRALGHRTSGHFFQAQRLGAELHLVGAMALRLAALVFDRKGGLAAVAAAEFDEIGDAREVEPAGGERQRRDAAHAARLARAGLCVTSCSTRPSAVKRFSSHSRSIWISAAWRRQ